MIQSMTAFAREMQQGPWGLLTWEIRSVNHRYLDLNLRLPEGFRDLEPELRQQASQALNRGKVECQLSFAASPSEQGTLQINTTLAQQIIGASEQLSNTLLPQSAPLNCAEVLRWPGVLNSEAPDLAPAREVALTLFHTTLEKLNQHRRQEGTVLKRLITEKLQAMSEHLAPVKQRWQEVVAQIPQRINDRAQQLQVELDKERLEQEVVLLINKLDICEELDRLVAHIQQVHSSLEAGGTLGRRLDFLMQELNREANTLASKSTDTLINHSAVELKVLIEQVREQVQNIA